MRHFSETILQKQNSSTLGILRHKINFHKIQNWPPQMGFNDKICEKKSEVFVKMKNLKILLIWVSMEQA